MDCIAVGRKVKMYRKKRNMTQAKLAEELGVTAKYISSIETGASTTSLSRLEEIAKILGVEVAMLISDCDITSSSYANSEILTRIEGWSVKEKDFLIGMIDLMNRSRND